MKREYLSSSNIIKLEEFYYLVQVNIRLSHLFGACMFMLIIVEILPLYFGCKRS